MFCAKKLLQKTSNIPEIRAFSKSALCKGYSPCKILALAQKFKLKKKHVNIHFTNHLQLFCAKNRSKKHQICDKWDHFEKRPSCKGYSPCKILILAQKFKLQKPSQNLLYKSFTVVLCRKPLQKTPNIPEMRASWNLAIMQRL